jgi:hypothetical protein
LQKGLDEDMVSTLSHFEDSDLPERVKVALRIAKMVATYPKGLTDELWAEARQHFSEDELVDIVLLATFTTESKVTVVLGLDPGGVQVVFYPTDPAYGEPTGELKEAIEDLRQHGLHVESEEQFEREHLDPRLRAGRS